MWNGVIEYEWNRPNISCGLSQLNCHFYSRPDWEKCADNVRGGATRWQELSEGKTSNELVDVLLTELASGEVVDTGGVEYFDGQVNIAKFPMCSKSFNCIMMVVSWPSFFFLGNL